jgi:hypothetical protein
LSKADSQQQQFDTTLYTLFARLIGEAAVEAAIGCEVILSGKSA